MALNREQLKQLYLDCYKTENFEKFFPHAFELPTQWFHNDINEFFDRNPQLACVICPRDVGKTTNVTLYKQTLRRIAYRQEKFIAVFSENKDKASGFLQTIKNEIKNNKKFAKFYGLSIPQGYEDTKYGVRIRTGSGERDFIILKVFGADMDVRGLNVDSIRPTLIILDDYEGKAVRESLNTRKKISDRFWSEIYRSKDSVYGKIWVVGTPVHEDAIIWKLHSDKKIPSKYFSSIKDNGSALWEERKSLREIDFEKRLAEEQGATALAIFYAEQMCDPSPVEMQVLNPQKLKKYNMQDIESKIKQMRRFVIVDLQHKGKDDGDYDVFTTVGVIRTGMGETHKERWYILNIQKGRWSEPRKLEILEQLVLRYDPYVGIEDVGAQRYFIDSAERQQDNHDIHYKIEKLQPRGVNKKERIISLETPLVNGTILIPDHKPEWVADLVHEMTVWSPTKDNSNDDILDTLAYIPQMIKIYGGGSFYEEQRGIAHGYYEELNTELANVYNNI